MYFEDWNRNHRLVVPESLRVDIMSEVHNTITEAAHGGYAKTYNQIAAIYYWPSMSRDIKKYISTCDICQKTKPRCHAPVRMLRVLHRYRNTCGVSNMGNAGMGTVLIFGAL